MARAVCDGAVATALVVAGLVCTLLLWKRSMMCQKSESRTTEANRGSSVPGTACSVTSALSTSRVGEAPAR